MIQQYYSWLYIQRNVSKDTIETLAHPCLLQLYSQTPDALKLMNGLRNCDIPENSTKKFLAIIDTFSKIAGYKMNLQQINLHQLLFYTLTMNRLRKNIGKQFHLFPQKYLGINLTKEKNDFHNENYKLLKKEIKEDFKRWKDLL
jgi:hypothetical protein